MTETPESVLEGAISIDAALRSGSRPIHQLIVREDALREPTVVLIMRRCREAAIPVEALRADDFNTLAQGKTHGGVIARVGDRQMTTLDALIDGQSAPFIAMLDGVEDPFNFGQAVRALYAAGAHGLVVRPRNWLSAAGVVARASAGASEWLPTAVAESAQAAADYFRGRGLRIAVTDQHRARSIYDVDLTVPMFIVIGGEKRGVTRSFADSADVRLTIPYGRAFAQALDTTSAVAALAFEVMRQRMPGMA